MKYRDKFYRTHITEKRWTSFQVKVETSDILIRARDNFSEKAKTIVEQLRNDIRTHIKIQSNFLSSHKPIERLQNIPTVIEMMYEASEIAGVGPMAAVAGTIAEILGYELKALSEEIIIENGGDIWLYITEPIKVKLYSGDFTFANKIVLNFNAEKTPCAICTSSGKIGHSFSYGKADAATVIAQSGAIADALATGTCNKVESEKTVQEALSYALSSSHTRGVLIVYRDTCAIQGDIELTDPNKGE